MFRDVISATVQHFFSVIFPRKATPKIDVISLNIYRYFPVPLIYSPTYATIVYCAILIVIGPDILSRELSDEKRQIQTFTMA